VDIVEGGAERSSPLEFKGYLQISIGSCEECKLWFEMSRDEGHFKQEKGEPFSGRFKVVGAMLRRLWKNWKNLAM
jgi:four helix bundle protein